ncbi:MAG: non-canonical purine NTP pyrophosphatase [Gallionellaceae bacterium]
MRKTIPLVTSNFAKYALFHPILERLGIELVTPPQSCHEIQSDNWGEIIEEKARSAARSLGRPCIVDDAGLMLDAYPGFPGAYTKSIIQSLGSDGLIRLLNNQTPSGHLVAYLACSDGDECIQWMGSVQGNLVPSEFRGKGPGPLHEWFQPTVKGPLGKSLHRLRAWRSLERDWHLLCERGWAYSADINPFDYTRGATTGSCAFCTELSGDPGSIFERLSGGSPSDRVVHMSTSFVLLPPLGQFMEGGLLLLSREHLKSMAYLEANQISELEDLMSEVTSTLRGVYGSSPVFFEHGPRRGRGKSTCCVDHAHLNIFPADVDLMPLLGQFPGHEIGSLGELASLSDNADDYIFVQHGDGTRTVHFSEDFPSQFIRREITRQLGYPERWHWRDYPGITELRATYNRLHGAFSEHVSF